MQGYLERKANTLKKLICLSLCLGLLLTGCGEVPDSVMSYDLHSSASSSLAHTSDIYRGNLFSDDLCVIPKDRENDSDAVMSAQAALLIDDTNGKILFSKNIYEKLYPASITKIVTALVALKYGNMSDTVKISYNASHISEWGATKCGFAEGDKVKMKTLLNSFLIHSGNDAGIAIAEHMAGSVEEFAVMMNDEVKLLGCTGTNFINPHGLHDDNHYTTAYDLYLIFHELKNYDDFLKISHKKSYKAKYKDASGNKIVKTFTTTDRYLNGKAEAPQGVTVVAGKTGTTNAAGSCLILYSTNDNGNDYISIVLKADYADSLFYQMTHLLEME